MVYAKQNPAVLGFLGRALSLELTAVQQYLTLARLLSLRGFGKLGEKFQNEVKEELGHAERIINRMLVLGVAPNASQLRPVRLGDSLPALLASVSSLETEIVSFYQQAVNECARIDDFDNRAFFEELLQEEREHARTLAQWREQVLGKPT